MTLSDFARTLVRAAFSPMSGIAVACLSSALASEDAKKDIYIIDDFNGHSRVSWKAESRAKITFPGQASTGEENAGGLVWTFKSDGKNRYGNSINVTNIEQNIGDFEMLEFEVFAKEPPLGRIGCQLILEDQQIVGLENIHAKILPGEWAPITLPIPSDLGARVVGIRLFHDGEKYTKDFEYQCQINNIRATGRRGAAPSALTKDAKAAPQFSELSAGQRSLARILLQPAPVAERQNPYSTPMYYQQWGSNTPDHTQRSDWQEALIKEFAEVGMTKLHFYLYPQKNGAGRPTYDLSEASRTGIKEFIRLCKKHNLKIGLRVDLPNIRLPQPADGEKKGPKVSYWISNPRNPENELDSYFGWLKEVMALMKGNTEYIVLGDEVTDSARGSEQDWTQKDFIEVLRRGSEVIREADPDVIISAYAASSGKYREVINLLDEGYAKYANALAFNHYDYNVVSKFMEELKQRYPDAPIHLVSNGVGYISSKTPHRKPPTDPYSKYNDEDQAGMIARTMYSWWLANATAAPYYVSIRTKEEGEEITPFGYGFFGIMDMVVDEHENMTFRRHPAWYAFRTIANVFDDRPAFKKADFEVTPTHRDGLYYEALVRNEKELTLIFWRTDKKTSAIDVAINSTDYGYPVTVDLLNHNKLTDVKSFEQNGTTILKDVQTGRSPTIIRILRRDLLQDKHL